MSRQEKLSKRSSLIYSKTEKERPNFDFSWLKLATISIFIILISYIVFFSGLFDIKKIEIRGYSYPEIIEEEVWLQTKKSILNKNIIFFRAGKLEDAFYGDATIENIKIQKVFPSKIIIEIEESKPVIIWNTMGEKYLINERGEVLQPAREENLIGVFDALNINVKVGERVASPTFIKFIKLIGERFEIETGVKISKIIIYDVLTDVHVLTNDGWTVYLDASKDPESQLKNLGRILDEIEKSGRNSKKIQYIDLRLGDKAFYK